MIIYIYKYSGDYPEPDDARVDQYDGADNYECEAWAADNYSDTERYYWTYTPWVDG